MKKLFLLAILVVVGATSSRAQVLVTVGTDVIKSDFVGLGRKFQFGAEANYFFTRKFTVSAGYDFWTSGRPSVIIGTRFYPIDPVFIRMRGLIGENDVAFGLGYWMGLSDRIRGEIALDYYVVGSAAGLRVGLGYRFGKR